jgi:hypothetical protein
VGHCAHATLKVLSRLLRSAVRLNCRTDGSGKVYEFWISYSVSHREPAKV